MRPAVLKYQFSKGFPLIFLLIISCTVRLIAPYDEVTDQKTAELQEFTMLSFKKWTRDLPEFEEAQDFYDQAEVTLEMLVERNQAIKQSGLVVEMLQKILDNIALIKTEHKAGRLNEVFIEEISPDINAQFNAIQKFQMSLKRAENNRE